MKKIIFGLMILVFTACNNSTNEETTMDTTASKNSGVNSVNGNIPDTTNTINIDGGKSDVAPDTLRK